MKKGKAPMLRSKFFCFTEQFKIPFKDSKSVKKMKTIREKVRQLQKLFQRIVKVVCQKIG